MPANLMKKPGDPEDDPQKPMGLGGGGANGMGLGGGGAAPPIQPPPHSSMGAGAGGANPAPPPATPPPSTQAAPPPQQTQANPPGGGAGVAPGWEDAGNGMARNPQTGQMLPTNHPLYQQMLAQQSGGQGTSQAALTGQQPDQGQGQDDFSIPPPADIAKFMAGGGGANPTRFDAGGGLAPGGGGPAPGGGGPAPSGGGESPWGSMQAPALISQAAGNPAGSTNKDVSQLDPASLAQTGPGNVPQKGGGDLTPIAQMGARGELAGPGGANPLGGKGGPLGGGDQASLGAGGAQGGGGQDTPGGAQAALLGGAQPPPGQMQGQGQGISQEQLLAQSGQGGQGQGQGKPGDLGGAYKDALLNMLGQGQQTPSLNDPALKAQSDAFAVGQQRSLDKARNALAERSAYDGGAGVNSGAFNNDLAGMYQQQGEAQGQFNAGLVGQELQNKRNQLQSAAALAGQTLSQDQQLALQREMANVDAQIRQSQLSQQGRQFDQSLAEQQRQYGGNMGLERDRLAEQQRQFGGTMGLEQAKLAEQQRQYGGNMGLEQAKLRQQGSQFGQSLAEQRRQSDVDAKLKEMGINSQNSLGQGDLALRGDLGRGQLNLGLLSTLLQNKQAGDSLGAQVGMFNSNANNNALLQMLGML